LDVLEFYAEQTMREEEEYGTSELQGAVERMSGVNWAKMMQENNSIQQQQQQQQQLQQPASQIKPNVKLPPKTIPTRPAPPPPIAGLADMNLQVNYLMPLFFYVYMRILKLILQTGSANNTKTNT
jgi:hypothetical protein